jgi:hypothetical protein
MTLSPMNALVVLAWVAISVLAFALAGILRQIRVMEQLRYAPLTLPSAVAAASGMLSSPHGAAPGWLDATRLTAILFVSPGCSACRDVLRGAGELAVNLQDRIVFRLVPTDSGRREPGHPDLVPLNDAPWLQSYFAVGATPVPRCDRPSLTNPGGAVCRLTPQLRGVD